MGITMNALSPAVRSAIQAGLVVPAPGQDFYVAAAAGNCEDHWPQTMGYPSSRTHSTITDALAVTTGGVNERIYLSPENHTQSASITWNKNMTHLVGAFPPAMMNQRSRIGHSTNDFATLLNVTGYGNLFQNLYFMYGNGDNATNVNGITVAGERNSFIHCHFLCGHATETSIANFDLVRVNCNEGYFYKCTFGNDTISWGNGDLVRLYGAADRSCRVVFEDCLFIMNQDAGADGNFLETVAGMGSGVAFFLNCQFVNIGTTMDLGIDGSGLGNGKLFFDNRCVFSGVTAVTSSGPDASVLCGNNYAGAAATANLIGSFADNS